LIHIADIALGINAIRKFTQETGISDPKIDFYLKQRLDGEEWAARYSLTWRKFPWFHGHYGIDMGDVGTTAWSDDTPGEGYVVLDHQWRWNDNPRKRGAMTGISTWEV